jgi:hypothetical protein
MPVPENDRHLQPDEIERYSLGGANEDATARWEEHLLTCDPCRRQVEASDSYTVAMRNAATAIRNAPEEREVHRWSLFHGFMPALAALALLAVLGAVLLPRLGHAPSAFAVHLDVTRGSAGEAHAPARTPLILQPDLTGLPAWQSYGLQVVDGTGKQVWRGSLMASDAARGASIPELRRGVYFVRVYSPEGELRREYALDIGAR